MYQGLRRQKLILEAYGDGSFETSDHTESVLVSFTHRANHSRAQRIELGLRVLSAISAETTPFRPVYYGDGPLDWLHDRKDAGLRRAAG